MIRFLVCKFSRFGIRNINFQHLYSAIYLCCKRCQINFREIFAIIDIDIVNIICLILFLLYYINIIFIINIYIIYIIII